MPPAAGGRARLIIFGLLSEAGYLVVAHPATPLNVRLACQALVFLIYLAAIREVCRAPFRRSTAILWAFAILFRISLVFQPPFYSGDLYRYLWDGHVQAAGHLNPYRFAPSDPAVARLRIDALALVNHPEIPTLYPPVAQIFFAVVAAVGGSALLLKSCLILFDLAVIQVIGTLLRRVGADEGRITVYAWSPLVITEVAGNGHIDALAILLLLLGIQLIIVGRWRVSTILLGLAAGAKLAPLAAFPALAQRVPKRGWWIPFAVLLVVTAPYLGAGSALGRGLWEYAGRWRHNDSLFGVLLGALEVMNPTAGLKAVIFRIQQHLGDSAWIQALYSTVYPVYLARWLAVALWAGVAFEVFRRRLPPLRGSFLLIAAALLLSPTVHPWYVLWIVPFLPLRPDPAWVLFTGLVPASYLIGNSSVTEVTIRIVEYLPLFLLLLLEALRSGRTKPITLFGLSPVPEPMPDSGDVPHGRRQ
ncbi:MAG TPA: glycosyltransferase 87 family protein [Candidatus Polarisedimenticolia bacterium]|nr:glycosyltransferase 87 family protein [Candidatus Polarisedimenticolia bacterium]